MEACKGFAGLLLVAVLLMGLMDSSVAYTFFAGGRDGWVQHPSESYDDWAGSNRFQVNDTIVFRYKKGQDSVLVANEQDYDACNVNSPIEKLDGGDSRFKFDRSGPFFFISGVPENCKQGQKLVVVVMAVRHAPPISSPPSPTPSKPPVPSVPAPQIPSLSPSPAPSSLPSVPSPSPSSPATGGRAPAPSPTPARPPTPAPSAPPSPALVPPSPSSPGPAPGEPPSSSSSTNASKLSLTMMLALLGAAPFLA